VVAIDLAPSLDELGWCPFAAATSKPCIVCGGTRAMLSLLGGDAAAALRYNAVVVLLAVAATLHLGWALVSSRRLAIFPRYARLWGRIMSGGRSSAAAAALFALWWVWNVGRW
jgi:hypothetical protein